MLAAAMVEKRGKPTQVNVRTKSLSEYQRWKLEAERRGWSITLLIRTAVNSLIDSREEEQRKAVG
jgi:hypothetical protein